MHQNDSIISYLKHLEVLRLLIPIFFTHVVAPHRYYTLNIVEHDAIEVSTHSRIRHEHLLALEMVEKEESVYEEHHTANSDSLLFLFKHTPPLPHWISHLSQNAHRGEVNTRRAGERVVNTRHEGRTIEQQQERRAQSQFHVHNASEVRDIYS